jgi:hypothetical protein
MVRQREDTKSVRIQDTEKKEQKKKKRRWQYFSNKNRKMTELIQEWVMISRGGSMQRTADQFRTWFGLTREFGHEDGGAGVGAVAPCCVMKATKMVV